MNCPIKDDDKADVLVAYCARTLDANRVILTGENPFIRLSQNDGDTATTSASFWRILFCPDLTPGWP